MNNVAQHFGPSLPGLLLKSNKLGLMKHEKAIN